MAEKHKAEAVQGKGRPGESKSRQALERRREQLRIAQKAYRTRKENTIGNLQDRVHELEGGIEQLSLSFLTFSNLLLETGLLERNSLVTSALRKITQQTLLLAETGCADPDNGALVKVVGATSSTAVDNDEKCSDSSPRVSSKEQVPTGLSSTPTQWDDLPPLYTQSSIYQDQPKPPISVAMAPLADESHSPFSSLPGHYPAVALATSTKDEQWTFSRYLVKVCCQNGYQLLVNTPNDFTKIQEVFGPSMPPTKRNNLLSCIHAGIHDKTGGLIDLMATVLAPLYSKRDGNASEELPALAEELGDSEWLDASGVQRLLNERGLYTRQSGRPLFRSSLISSPQVAALVQYLATECVCFGIGPAFRRQTVAAALNLSGMP
ncbi:uncharacterized protein N7484_008244 [Penicillium longicatenatum]|uniref:uncharacterized protein n=1 Tax=Penicillium longicatenatum TaxID=1561947 RepID=UPI002547A93A|nr:uncharacterized protein N7484_008244 [Penicillium longicatenatum]KAJ5634931.1 hypothetical protein N7484_008244 [Penicillium longicatenatum]